MATASTDSEQIREFSRAILHGDEVHRAWLLAAAEAFIDGRPVPAPRAVLSPEPSEVERLRRDCAELYQVIGTMADHCPDPEDAAIIKALDNASDAAQGQPRRHSDLLPFILPASRPSPDSEAEQERCANIASRFLHPIAADIAAAIRKGEKT